jgi:hypothetical protein
MISKQFLMEEIVKELNTITLTRPDHKSWALADLTRYKWNNRRFAQSWESLMEDAECYPNTEELCEHCLPILTRRIKDVYEVDICDFRLKLLELCERLDVLESKIQILSSPLEPSESKSESESTTR